VNTSIQHCGRSRRADLKERLLELGIEVKASAPEEI
jgi:hypothetical protein